jgi:hypothetical protein
MAEHETPREKYLYVFSAELVVQFLNGGRAMSSVLSRNETLRKKSTKKFRNRYRTVREYYLSRKASAVIADVSPFVPGLVPAGEVTKAEEE